MTRSIFGPQISGGRNTIIYPYIIYKLYIYMYVYIYTQTMCIYIYVHRHSGLVSHGSSHWDAQPLKPWTSSYELCTACLKVLYMCYVYTVLYIYMCILD
jgi:hypothetical protein